LWKASDTVDVLLTAMRQENKGDNFATVALDPATFKPKLPGYSNEYLFLQPSTIKYDVYGLTVDWDVGWADFTSASSWMKSNSWRLQD
ncbi:hypothetical protein DSI35_01270, partial [Mycobacterium tuberculosis]